MSVPHVSSLPASAPGALLTRFGGVAFDLLRIVAGALIALHGAQKLFGVLGGLGGTPGATAPLGSSMGIAGLIELVGGVLIAIGLLTRPVAFLASGLMAVTYLMEHVGRSFWPVQNGGEAVLLSCFVFLLFAATGAGPLSLDALLRRRRRRRSRG